MTETDPILEQAREAVRHFRDVFNETPEIAIAALADAPDGEAIIINGWLWLFRSLGTRWSVRIRLDDAWFRKFSCFARKDGYEIEKPSFDEAMIYVLQNEAHRRFHAAKETSRCLKAI